MNEFTKSKGCFAVIILAAIGLLAIPVLIYGVFMMKRTSAVEELHEQTAVAYSIEQQAATDNPHEIHFKKGSWPRSIAEIGDELSRENFVVFMADSNATTLSRNAFIKNANGRKVRWMVCVVDINAADSSAILHGNFELPYKIFSENGYTGSSVSIEAEFPSSEESALMPLQRDDWVTIEGRIEINSNNSAILHEAKVVAK